MTRIPGGLIISFFIITVRSDTVHFTNSPTHLTRNSNYTSYKLDVPGSDGITIIEANNDFPSEDDQRQPLKFFVRGPNEHELHDVRSPQGQKKMVYAPELLNKFIQEYAAKTKDASSENEKQLSSIENGRVNLLKVHQNKKTPPSSSDRPFDNKEGWVTLEAVPWSRSQVSKWKSNSGSKNSATVSGVSLYNLGQVTSLDKSHVYYGENQDNLDDSKFNNYPTKRPSFYRDPNKDEGFNDRNVLKPTRNEKRHQRPQRKKDQGYYADKEPDLELSSSNDHWYDYGFRPNLDDEPRPDPYQSDDIPTPPENGYHSYTKRDPYRDETPPSSLNTYHSRPNRDPYGDELPAPSNNNYQSNSYNKDKSYVYEQRPDSMHPPTYPANGNGEWVLVSTTRGYQYPSRTQRGISFNSPPASPSNHTINVHKSVKLTVLPAKATASNRRPMTTSYGGLLEVDSSLQTVENSALKANKKKAKGKNKSKSKRGSSQIVRAIPVDNVPRSDSSAVLAAVSAGMVPATVAMLMPILGRRKREVIEQLRDDSFY